MPYDAWGSYVPSRRTLIRDAEARVTSVPKGDGPQFYGVELEVECGDHDVEDIAREIKPLLRGVAIMKDEGSVSNGFEIVTRPMSVIEHRRFWKNFIAKRSRKLRSESTSTCGLHVHCTRQKGKVKVIPDDAVARIVEFVNNSKHKPLVTGVARRSAARWAAFKNKPLGAAAIRTGDKFEAVNLCPRNTIEFRIFKGALTLWKIYSAIEFCDSLISCAKATQKVITQSAYLDFVAQQNRRWTALFNHLQRLNKEKVLEPRPAPHPVSVGDSDFI